MHTVCRKEKVSMFLIDYYTGNSRLVNVLRIIGGPILICMGLNIYQNEFSKTMIAYGGFLALYGGYMVFKPILFILLRLDSFSTEQLSVEIAADFIHLTSDQSESKLNLESCKSIKQRKQFFVITISKAQKLRIPKRLLKDVEISVLSDRCSG
jgi:hypothetical protein